VLIYEKLVIFIYSFHAAEGTVPIVIKFFVHGRPLIDFHQSDIGNQQFQFIFRETIHIFMKLLRFLKIHAHKSTKSPDYWMLPLFLDYTDSLFHKLVWQHDKKSPGLYTDKNKPLG